MKVKVGHIDVIVRGNDGPIGDTEDAGQWDGTKGECVINTQQSPALIAETVIHELMHALWLNAGLPGRASEERAVNSLSKGLSSLIRDNPELIRQLARALNGRPFPLN